MVTKKKYELVGGDDSDDDEGQWNEEQSTLQQQSLDSFISQSIIHVMDIYQKSSIRLFSPEYYMTYVSMRVWLNFRRFLVFLVKDDFEAQNLSIYSKVVYLNEEMNDKKELYDNEIYIIPYQEIDIAFGSKLRALEWENRKIFFKFLIDSFLVGDSTDNQSNQSSEDNLEAPISIDQYNPESVYIRQFYLKNSFGYAVAFRLTMLSFNAVPLGFKLEKFNLEKLFYEQIVFFIIHPRNYLTFLPFRCLEEKFGGG